MDRGIRMSIRDANPEPAYLGDSVYARPSNREGENLVLYLDNGTGRHAAIIVDPQVWQALKKYVASNFPHWGS